MATVKNTIRLSDKMTPVLRSIIRALNSTISALEKVDGVSDRAFKGAKKDIEMANMALNDMISDTQRLEQPVRNVHTGFSNLQATIVTINQGVQLLGTLVGKVGQITAFADRQTMLSSRLALITGDYESAIALEDKIMASANRSRAAYMSTAESVSQLALQASEAFTTNGVLNTDEIIAFTEAINKQLVMSGVAGTQGADAALYQLTQAMSSGVLRGDELRSIMEQAPVIADTVAKYMGVTKGEMRLMAHEGLVTSDIVKNAMLSSLEDTNEKFETMPTTFGQAMSLLKNKAIRESKPIVEQFSNFINSDAFESAFTWAMATIPSILQYIQGLIDKFAELGDSPGAQQFAEELGTIANIIGWVLEQAVNLAVFILDNWNYISPIVWGIVGALAAYAVYLGIVKTAELIGAGVKITAMLASYAHAAATNTQASATAKATAAQYGFNTALLASPITWIILALIALITIIFIVVNVVNEATGSTTSALGVIFGAVFTLVAFIWNAIVGLVDLILGVVNTLVNPILAFVNFFGNVFNDPIASIINLFADLADNVLGVLESIAGALDSVFGSNMASTVAGWRKDLKSMAEVAAKEYGNGTYEKIADAINLSAESLGMSRWEYGDAYDMGYGFGQSTEKAISDTLQSFDIGDLTKAAEEMAKDQEGLNNLANGGDGGVHIQGEVSITDEDIKMLKDIAAAEWVNKYTTLKPEMTVTFGDVHETADAEQLLSAIETMVEEAYASALVGG